MSDTRGARFAPRTLVLALLCAAAPAPQARAHDARPAYLQISETSPGSYYVRLVRRICG